MLWCVCVFLSWYPYGVCVLLTVTELSPGLRDSKCIDGIDVNFRAIQVQIKDILQIKCPLKYFYMRKETCEAFYCSQKKIHSHRYITCIKVANT